MRFASPTLRPTRVGQDLNVRSPARTCPLPSSHYTPSIQHKSMLRWPQAPSPTDPEHLRIRLRGADCLAPCSAARLRAHPDRAL